MKSFVLLSFLFSFSAYAENCAVNLPDPVYHDVLNNHSSKLFEKNYVFINQGGSYTLKVKELIEHVGSSYNLAGYKVTVVDANRNVIATGTSNWGFLGGMNKSLKRALKKAYEQLPECELKF